MYPKHFSTEKNLNIVRLLTLFRGQKCLKKIPNKIIAYNEEKSTALSQNAGIVSTKMKDQE
jgi:hypothetical protein